MNRFPTLAIIVLSLIVIFAICAEAQDRVQASIAFSNLNVVNENTQGWSGEVAVKAFRYDNFKLSGVGHVNGHYEGGESAHQFLAGPQVSYEYKNRISPFVRGLFGTTYYQGNTFTKAVGFGLDLRLTKRISFRPAVVDFQWTDATGDLRFTRYGVGLNFHF